MNKSTVWAWAIKNSVCMICWVILAIVFDKWWIALFGLLFMSAFQTKVGQCRVCDKCGKRSPYADSHNEALDKAKAAGWVHYESTNTDYCPDCQQ